jgi:hypothetical protein
MYRSCIEASLAAYSHYASGVAKLQIFDSVQGRDECMSVFNGSSIQWNTFVHIYISPTFRPLCPEMKMLSCMGQAAPGFRHSPAENKNWTSGREQHASGSAESSQCKIWGGRKGQVKGKEPRDKRFWRSTWTDKVSMVGRY